MYETFEHTADLGIRARAATLDELFVDAARGLFSVIVANPESIRPDQRVELRIAGADHEYLLFDWLKDLLFRFDAEHIIFGKFEAHIDGAGLVGAAWGEPLDRSRHLLEHEVKAITYHALRVQKVNNVWEAEVIVDI